MLALVPKLRLFPVLLPDVPEDSGRPAARARRRRLAPATRMLVVAACLVLPAIAYVHQSALTARTGYLILSLRQDINVLQGEHARLTADVMALRSPQRIERIAVRDLGMAPPRGSQFAALTLPPAAAAVPSPPLSWRERLLALFVDRAAAAGESR
jgi:cell division protein FtsL